MNHFDPMSLRLFVAACEERSITGAADRESLTTSAVSKRISALEAQVGAPLLERGRGRVLLTAAGEALLPAARALLQSMAYIQANVSEYGRRASDHVRMVATVSAISSYLPQDVGAFTRRHRNVRVSLHECRSEDLVRSVEEGRADLGVLLDSMGASQLQSVAYREDRLVVLVHPQHALAGRRRVRFIDTLPYGHVAIQGGSAVHHAQEQMAVAAGKALRFDVLVSTFDAACRIVAADLAIAIAPHEATRALARALRIKAIPLAEDWAARRLVICMRDSNALTASARLLLHALTDSRFAATSAGSSQD